MLPDTFPWWGLLVLATAAFTDVVTDLLPAGLLPQMSRSLHVPEARIGLLVSAFAIASALAAIPVDRHHLLVTRDRGASPRADSAVSRS